MSWASSFAIVQVYLWNQSNWCIRGQSSYLLDKSIILQISSAWLTSKQSKPRMVELAFKQVSDQLSCETYCTQWGLTIWKILSMIRYVKEWLPYLIRSSLLMMKSWSVSSSQNCITYFWSSISFGSVLLIGWEWAHNNLLTNCNQTWHLAICTKVSCHKEGSCDIEIDNQMTPIDIKISEWIAQTKLACKIMCCWYSPCSKWHRSARRRSTWGLCLHLPPRQVVWALLKDLLCNLDKLQLPVYT